METFYILLSMFLGCAFTLSGIVIGSAVGRKVAKDQRKAKETAIIELTEALRLTAEYVGLKTLPAIPGWSWYNALCIYRPGLAARLKRQYDEIESPFANK